jgi:UDP-N-acetylglucosamine--N-acetylmuramyl-(pentapeptide) pyrophosphoryl-undecaprenol N-acetylglucosamine transferase
VSNAPSSPLRVLIAGGGTGGHVFPAVAIRQAIGVRQPNAKVIFVGTGSGIEARLIPQMGETLQTIWISGLSRSRPLQNLLLPLKLLVSIIQSLWLLLKFRPHVAIGTGGYVMGPVLWLAQKMGIATILQEQNSFPGLTTKKLARRATAVCVGFEDAIARIPAANITYTGNPLRQSFRTLKREEGQSKWPLDFRRRTILVVGGSAGARSINEVVADALPQLMERYNLIWQTGKTGVPDRADTTLIQKCFESRRLVLREFIDDMPSAYAVVDLAVCRAGAMTLAELAAAGVSAVLVPYPFATDDHQTVNAESVIKVGGALMITDRDLSAEALLDAVTTSLESDEVYSRMARAMKSLAKPDAALDIADIAIQAARKVA